MTAFTPEEMAISYASLGWQVIPVLVKRPIYDAWQTLVTCDQAKAAKMFATSRHDGVGVQLGKRSNLVDFDADSSEAEETFQRLFEGVEIKTAEYQSARGKHRLFQWSDKLPRPDLIKIVVDGLEIRTGNGDKGCQTVFPPSGDRQWIVWPDEVPTQPIPEIVIERICKRYEETNKPKAIKARGQSSTAWTDTSNFTNSGQSSGSLDVPAWLRKHGREIIGRTDGSDGVTRWHIECPGIERHTTANSYRDCCVTQAHDGTLGGSCFHSSCGMADWPTLRDTIGPLTYEDFEDNPLADVPVVQDPFECADEAIEDCDGEVVDDAIADSFDGEFPAECLRPPGLIGEIIDYTLQTAKYPQPIHSLAAALSLMSLLTGRRVRDISKTRTNIMSVALGPTRSGKEYPRQVIKEILDAIGASEMLEEKLASNAALHGFLKHSYAGLLINDEFGDQLALARSKTGMNTQPAQIISSMLKLYSSPGCKYKADRYAENSKQVVIEQPHLVFMGTSTGDVFWKHVTPEYLSGGLFGRMMIFENHGYVLPQSSRDKDFELPESIVSDARIWLTTTPSGIDPDFFWEKPTPIIVPHSSDALERYETHELTIAERRLDESKVHAALWSGTAEITAKLALLFACSRSRNPLLITIDDVNLAIRLSNWLTRRKVSLCADHVAENATEDATKRVYRLIKSEQRKGITQTDLTRHTQWADGRQRREILETLRSSGQIVITQLPTKTKSKTVYMATVYAKEIVQQPSNVGHEGLKDSHPNPSILQS